MPQVRHWTIYDKRDNTPIEEADSVALKHCKRSNISAIFSPLNRDKKAVESMCIDILLQSVISSIMIELSLLIHEIPEFIAC